METNFAIFSLLKKFHGRYLKHPIDNVILINRVFAMMHSYVYKYGLERKKLSLNVIAICKQKNRLLLLISTNQHLIQLVIIKHKKSVNIETIQRN